MKNQRPCSNVLLVGLEKQKHATVIASGISFKLGYYTWIASMPEHVGKAIEFKLSSMQIIYAHVTFSDRYSACSHAGGEKRKYYWNMFLMREG